MKHPPKTWHLVLDPMEEESCGLNSVMVILLIPLSLYPGGKSLEVVKFQDKFILPGTAPRCSLPSGTTRPCPGQVFVIQWWPTQPEVGLRPVAMRTSEKLSRVWLYDSEAYFIDYQFDGPSLFS